MSFVKNYTTNEEEHRLEKVPCKVVNNIHDIDIFHIMTSLKLIKFSITYMIIVALDIELIEYFKDFPSKTRSIAKNLEYRPPYIDESKIMDYKLDIPDTYIKEMAKGFRDVCLSVYQNEADNIVGAHPGTIWDDFNVLKTEIGTDIMTNTLVNRVIVKLSCHIYNTCYQLYFCNNKGIPDIIYAQNKYTEPEYDIRKWWDMLVIDMVYDFSAHINHVMNKFKRTPCRQILII